LVSTAWLESDVGHGTQQPNKRNRQRDRQLLSPKGRIWADGALRFHGSKSRMRSRPNAEFLPNRVRIMRHL
jgi:hypothetical protein